ncbi:MAG: 2,3-cyclic phosphodiesterase [Pseudomonadota bacterium]|jgi:2'-5' RNA ligase
MPRLFSAVQLPPEVAARLSLLRAPIDGARWVPVENLHLTLRFFGDVEGRMAREIAAELEDVAALPFELEISGCGAFGGRLPTTIFASLKPSAELLALQRAHERVARTLGLPREQHAFHPHITLARSRGTSPDAVARFLEAHGGFRLPAFTVDGFALLSSRPHTGGGPYAIEQSYPFLSTDFDETDEDQAAYAVAWDSRMP